jgi:hypothetical protein
MKINIIRLQGDRLSHEVLDTTLLLNIEFMLDDERSVCAMIENGTLYISSSSGRLRITPHVSNAVSIEVTE